VASLIIGILMVGFVGHLYSEGASSKTLPPPTVSGLNCPAKPNCVSSLAAGDHYIAPLQIFGPKPIEQLMTALQKAELIIEQHSKVYLHATATSAVFGFVDDIHILLPLKANGQFEVRSMSRVGYSDLGANRERIEELRMILNNQG